MKAVGSRLQLPARWAEIAELKAAATGTKLDDYVRDLVKRDLSRGAEPSRPAPTVPGRP
jgi:hypothetical protein